MHENSYGPGVAGTVLAPQLGTRSDRSSPRTDRGRELMAFDGSAIDRLLTGAVENGTYEGVVATVVDRDGVLYEGSAGTTNPDTMFRNASMTKAVATTAALQLLAQGQLALDQAVEEIPPQIAELQVPAADRSRR